MTQATAPRCTYRKTRNGTWAVMGPASQITAGRTVVVTKRDGSTKPELISSVGKTFTRDGQQMVYGYPERSSGSRNSSGGQMCDECGQRRGYIEARDMSGIPGLVCGRCIRDEGCLSFA